MKNSYQLHIYFANGDVKIFTSKTEKECMIQACKYSYSKVRFYKNGILQKRYKS